MSTISLRLPESLHAQARAFAEQEGAPVLDPPTPTRFDEDEWQW